MTMTFETTVETRLAFADRRKALLANWLLAHRYLTEANREAYWAERLLAVNDAEVAVLGGVQ